MSTDQPAHHELVVVVELPDLGRVAALADQPRERHVERELLEPAHVVDGQRVVHVEADQLDLVHAQVAVDEDLARPVDLPSLLDRVEELLELRLREQVRGHGLGGLGVGPWNGGLVAPAVEAAGRRAIGEGTGFCGDISQGVRNLKPNSSGPAARKQVRILAGL